MLENIGQMDLGYARQILNMLCVSLRPLTVAELSDGVAVELGEHSKFNPKRKLRDAEDIRRLLPGLIEISIDTDSAKSTVRIGHFSVQEYLVSDRIRLHSVKIYAVQRPDAHAQLSCICLTYLLECRFSWGETDEEGSLTRYAIRNWHKHFAHAERTQYSLEVQILKLFLNNEKFQDWAFFSNVDKAGGTRYDILIPPPLYHASLLGLPFVVSGLLEGPLDVNAKGGRYGTALQAASAAGHEKIVRLLLDSGADINSKSETGEYGEDFKTALQLSSQNGHIDVVRLLLSKTVNVSSQADDYGHAFELCSGKGYRELVRLFLDTKAEFCTQSLPSALNNASAGGHQEIVRLLLDRNADVNSEVGRFGTALQAASANGRREIVQLLLDRNADINSQSGECGTALQIASSEGHREIVQLLLDKNADIDSQSKYHRTALQLASAKGHRDIVQLLLDRNADVNSPGGYYRAEIIQPILDTNAVDNGQSRYCGTALHVASIQGHREIVQLLLDSNANVNSQSGYYGTAIQGASANGHREIVQLLLDRNADINSQGGCYGTALQAALAHNHEDVAQMLLEQPALGHREVITLPPFRLLLAE
jgi:ankyrin repeat protein